MKFLIFNVAVVAALGFILIDQNYLDRRIVEDLKGSAASLVERVTEPAAAPSPSRDVSGTVAEDRLERVAAAVADESEPRPAPVSAERQKADTVIEPPPAAPVPAMVEEAPSPPAAVIEDVPADVAERRSEVLSPPASGASDYGARALAGAERRDRLQALAEELEAMSVDMIYQ